MLFRYKIEKCVYESLDHALCGPGVGYRVTIQYYKPDARLFKWRHFDSHKLFYVLNKIKHAQCDIDTNDGLFNVLQQYNDTGEIMLKYIKKLMEDDKYKRYQKDVGNKIGNLVLTNGWNTIEIKENK